MWHLTPDVSGVNERVCFGWEANSWPPAKEIPGFYACRRIITMLIRPHISIQFCASTIYSTLPRPVFIQSIQHNILSSSLRFPTWPLFFWFFGIKPCKDFCSLPSVLSSLDITILFCRLTPEVFRPTLSTYLSKESSSARWKPMNCT